MGQLDVRLIKPYQRQPWNVAQLTDLSLPLHSRISFLQDLKDMRSCCVEKFFVRPFLNDVDEITDILPPNKLFQELCLSFRQKVSNMEIENNFARSLKMSQSNPHNIASLVAKHVTAEMKLGQRRLLRNCSLDDGLPQDPGASFLHIQTLAKVIVVMCFLFVQHSFNVSNRLLILHVPRYVSINIVLYNTFMSIHYSKIYRYDTGYLSLKKVLNSITKNRLLTCF